MQEVFIVGKAILSDVSSWEDGEEGNIEESLTYRIVLVCLMEVWNGSYPVLEGTDKS